MDDFSGKLFWNAVSRILAETVVALEELQERYACHRLTSKQAQAKIKVIMERLTPHYSVDYWQEFSERYSDENDFIGNNFDCEYYHAAWFGFPSACGVFMDHTDGSRDCRSSMVLCSVAFGK